MDQLLISAIFLTLMYHLVFTDKPATWVFVVAMLAAYFTGLVNTEEVLDKATNTGLITLLLLILVSVGLEKLTWLTRLSGRLVTAGYHQSLLRITTVTAVFSAFVNNTAVVATLANAVRNNPHHAGSRLLMPLSYAAILGGTLTLIGTSTNLVVSSFLEDATGTGLAFFDFFYVGAPAALVGLVVLLLSTRLLPDHPIEVMDVHEYLIEAEVGAESELVGNTILENGLRDLQELFLVELVRGEHLISPVSPFEHIEAGDKLIFSGNVKQLAALESIPGLRIYALEEGLLQENVIEAVILPNATIEGQTLKDAGFRSLFDAAVLGLRRGGKRLSGKLGNITLQAGDSLILVIGPDFQERTNLGKNFAIIDDEVIGARATPRENFCLTVGMIVVVSLAGLGMLSLIKGLALLLLGMLLTGIVKAAELRRRFPFELWLIIGSALTLAQALTNSGLVAELTEVLHSNLENLGPHIALAGIFLMTLLLTEVMTNNAAAALSFPLAFALAESYGLHYMPFVMAVAYGASASFLTPYGYTTNLMVQNLGGYEFKDYLRAGLPMSIAYSTTVIFLIPEFFPFHF